MRIEFKTERIEKEWGYKCLDKRLKTILYYVMGVIGAKFGYGHYVLITDIFRSDKEDKIIYGGSIPKGGNIHGCWRALDFVLKNNLNINWNKEQCENIVELLNERVRYHKKEKYKTLIFHSVQRGDAGHFHLQVSWKNETLLRR